MVDKEMQERKKNYYIEAFELTHNRWRYLTLKDLYIGIVYTTGENSFLENARWRSIESFNPERQLEVIHLQMLIDLVDKEILERFLTEMRAILPRSSNSIQPLYNPIENNDEIIRIELNEGIVEIHEHDLLYKPSAEI